MALFEVEVRLSAGGSGWIVQPARNEAEARRLVGVMFEVVQVKAIGKGEEWIVSIMF